MKPSEFINESSLSRIYLSAQNHATGAITAFRGNMSLPDNQENNKKLLSFLALRNYHVTRVIGSFIENQGGDAEQEVKEETFFVVNPTEGDDGGRLEDDLIRLGKLFNQDAILSKEFNGKNTIIPIPNPEKRTVYNNTHWGYAVGPGFTKVKGRPYSFFDSELSPQTNNGKRLMVECGREIERQLV